MSDFIWRQRGLLVRFLAAGVFVSLLLPFMLGGFGLLSAQDQDKKRRVEEEEDEPKAKPPKKKMAEEEEEPKAKQPKKRIPVEEEEEEAPKKKTKVIRVEDEEPKIKPPAKPTVPQPVAGDLRSLSKDPKLHAVIRRLYADMAEPHDVITQELKSGKKRVESIEPLPRYYGVDPKIQRDLEVRRFDENWKLLKGYHPQRDTIASIIPYEQVAQARIDEFLKITPEEGLSRRDLLAAARQVLVSVGRFHVSARERGRREGEEWDAVEKELKQKLFDVELQQLEDLLEADDWENGYTQAKHLFDYPSEAAKKRVAKVLADYVQKELPKGSLNTDRVRQLQERLKELEQLNPGGPASQMLGGTFEANARKLYEVGLKMVEKKQVAEAIVQFKKAMELRPQLPGLEDAYLKALDRHPILRVGVRSLPLNMAPGLAWTESERQAVELLFEGLLKACPEAPSEDDPRPGLHYLPCLADSRPQLLSRRQGPLPGRQFHIARDTYWSDSNRLKANDIVRTVRYLKNPKMPGYTPAWAELIDDVATGRDDTRVSLTLKHGYLDPCSLMTFKVLPNIDLAVYRSEFAHKPVGSGPYVHDRVTTINGRQVAIFKANPYYASRPGKLNLPRIREIHFIVVSEDPAADFTNDVIDLLLPEAYANMTEPEKLEKLSPKVKVIGPLPSRRVYFLAINHRWPVFQNADLRRALALVIDRKEMLKRFFGDVKGNLPLNGPYPADSWAAKDNQRMYDVALAKSLMDKARDKMKGAGELTIKFPADDDRARRAISYICDQIFNELKIPIKAVPVDPGELRHVVEDTHDYYLAYHHYDFPSAAYWLWPLFDPRGCKSEHGIGRGNFLGYENDGPLESLFRQVMTRCDFQDVRRLTHDIHAHMQEKMPLIPLWQLAEHLAIRDDYETGPLDPLLVLGDVEHWRRKTR
jgi:ABC-type transport system substrate-binding protein